MDTIYTVCIQILGILYTDTKSLVGFRVSPLAGWPVRPYQITLLYPALAE